MSLAWWLRGPPRASCIKHSRTLHTSPLRARSEREEGRRSSGSGNEKRQRTWNSNKWSLLPDLPLTDHPTSCGFSRLTVQERSLSRSCVYEVRPPNSQCLSVPHLPCSAATLSLDERTNDSLEYEEDDLELVQVQVITRHGARTPLVPPLRHLPLILLAHPGQASSRMDPSIKKLPWDCEVSQICLLGVWVCT